jgi:hypothetical protein
MPRVYSSERCCVGDGRRRELVRLAMSRWFRAAQRAAVFGVHWGAAGERRVEPGRRGS